VADIELVRVALAVPIFSLACSAPLFAGVEVTQAAGRVSIRADQATVSEVLERLSERTAMRVVYDGVPPPVVLTRTISNRTPVEAVVGLLEGLALKYAMVLDDSGAQVRVLLITTAPPPQRTAMADPEPAVLAEGPMVVVKPPDPPQPLAASAETEVPAVPPTPPASSPPTAYASYAGPFTPQGPGPIILPLPGGAAASGAVVAPAAAYNRAAAVAPAAASTPAPERTLLGTPSAALPPWMKAGYYGN
jgi:hypothetical protein